MKRRVGLGQALLNGPQVLSVDEPTCGLDGERIVILSAHIVAGEEAAATQISLLRQRLLLRRGCFDGCLPDAVRPQHHQRRLTPTPRRPSLRPWRADPEG